MGWNGMGRKERKGRLGLNGFERLKQVDSLTLEG